MSRSSGRPLPGYRIGELATMAGTTTRTIRHYHQIGLLPDPQRLSNGYRVYGTVDLARVLRIRQLRDTGMSLAHVAELLADSPDDPESVFTSLEQCLDAQIAELQRQKAMLDRLRREHRAGPAPGISEAVTQFDRDAWTVLSAQPGVDPCTTDPILTQLAEADTSELDAAAAQFDEVADDADEAEIDAVAHQLLAAGTAVMAAAGITPATDANPHASVAVADLAGETLRPGQQRVIARFLELVRTADEPDEDSE